MVPFNPFKWDVLKDPRILTTPDRLAKFLSRLDGYESHFEAPAGKPQPKSQGLWDSGFGVRITNIALRSV